MADKYQITTEDGAVYEIETEGGGVEVPRAGRGDFSPNGAPEGEPGMMEQAGRSMFESAAAPQSGMDIMGLMTAIPGLLKGATGAAGAVRSAMPGPKTGGFLRGASRYVPSTMDPARPLRQGLNDVGKWLQRPANVVETGAEAVPAAADPAAEFAKRFKLPSNAEVAADVTSKNIRTTPQYGGTKKPHITAKEYLDMQRKKMLEQTLGQ